MAHMTAKVPTREKGRASDGMSVAEARRRKNAMTRMTRTSVNIRVNFTSSKDSRMFLERSLRMSSVMFGGICAFSDGNTFLIASFTSMTLLPGWRCTMRLMARPPVSGP